MNPSVAIAFADGGSFHNNGSIRRRVVLKIDGEDQDVLSLKLDSDISRTRQAKRWADRFGLDLEVVEDKLRKATIVAVGDTQEQQENRGDTVEAASYADDSHIVELAWNTIEGQPDFIIYDRGTKSVTRSATATVSFGELVPPSCCKGIVTPGSNVPGNVLLPSEYDENGTDEDRLRADLRAFIDRYVELPGDGVDLAVEYVLLTYIFDGFSEIPYLTARTADRGRGKSRMLTTVGSVCYRPILCGGGSTAAATLRLLDIFGGTLIADEFDQRDSDASSELAKIINQGFEQNRPLVRCAGDDNAPHPYRCFSPKLFAFRQGLADDASESRCITIWMQQRTRKDIPISLPRKRFNAEALSLRNRLLAWRFANLGTIKVDESDADPRLEDRSNQIGLPLMAIAGRKGRARIVAALLQQEDSVAATLADSLPGSVFEVVLATVEVGGIVRPNEIARALNEKRATEAGVEVDRMKDPVKSWTVGRILAGDLELPRGEPKRDKSGVRYVLDATRVGQLRTRFGLPPVEPTQPASLHRTSDHTPKNSPGAIENAGDVGCATNVGLGAGVPPNATTPAPNTPEVPPDWSKDGWIARLGQMASDCEKLNPARAEEFRNEAQSLKGQK